MNALNTTAVKRLTELLATLGMQAGMNVDTPLSNWVGIEANPHSRRPCANKFGFFAIFPKFLLLFFATK